MKETIKPRHKSGDSIQTKINIGSAIAGSYQITEYSKRTDQYAVEWISDPTLRPGSDGSVIPKSFMLSRQIVDDNSSFVMHTGRGKWTTQEYLRWHKMHLESMDSGRHNL